MMKTAIEEINDNLLGCLPAHAEEKALAKGTRIESTAAAAVMPVSGRLAHVKELSETRRLILDFYGEDTAFLFADDDCGTRYVEVIDHQAKVMTWTTQQLAAVQEKRPEFARYLADWLRYKESALIERLAEFAASNTEEKLRLALLRLGRQLGVRTADGIKVPPFTHQNLAEYVSTSRELVSRMMGTFARKNLISYNRQGILLRSLVKEMAAST